MDDINICIKLIIKSQLRKASFYTYTESTYTTPKAAHLPKEEENFKYFLYNIYVYHIKYISYTWETNKIKKANSAFRIWY